MAQQLDDVLEELGLSQYLDAFVDQGFDTWDTILDVTESDLESLGVKLGHRRKLQRRIANFRGVAPDAALGSPTRPTVEEIPRADALPKAGAANFNLDSRGAVPGVLAKRKYRRHPKADESAPERPPSAYVLFSNKMREDLKGRNLSFTEIAKLVGENWQSLSPSEREPFETQAQAAKDKYNHDLSEYKKTPEYKKYTVYLQEFKAKHSNQTQDKDAFKRIKLSDFGNSTAHASPASGSVSPPATARHELHDQRARSASARASRSGSESQNEHETQHRNTSRKRRIGSTASATDSHYSASSTPGPQNGHFDGSVHSPTQHPISDHHSDRSPPPKASMSPREAVSSHSPRRSDNGQSNHQVNLPSLSDMFDDRRLPSNGLPPSAQAVETGSTYTSGSNAPTSTATSPGLPPHAMAASSSSASNGSGSSYTSSYPRTPLEGSLPIHALLSGKPASPPSPQLSAAPFHHHHPSHQHHSSFSSQHSPTSPPPTRHMPERRHSPSWPYPQTVIVDNPPVYRDHVSPILRQAGASAFEFRS